VYVTDEKLREALTMIADAGGELAVTCTVPQADPTATTKVHFGAAPKPVGWELWQLCRSLLNRGLAESDGMSESGTETFTLTAAGREVHDDPSRPMPPPPNAAVAAVGFRPPWGAVVE
jgi:hypothetical protein